jgi:hypothetical protein
VGNLFGQEQNPYHGPAPGSSSNRAGSRAQ